MLRSSSIALLLLTSCFRSGYDLIEDSPGGSGASAVGGFDASGGFTGGTSSSGGTVNGGEAGASGSNGSGTGTGGTSTGGTSNGGAGGSGGSSGGTSSGGTGGSGGASGCAPDPNCSCATFQNKLYRFCTKLVVFNDAQADCQAVGMELVEVETPEEDAWLFSEMVAKGQFEVTTSAAVFLGGRDLLGNGDWTWPDGTVFWSGGGPVSGVYSNWQRRPSGGAAPCMVMIDTGKWTNRSCNSGDVVHVCEQR